MRKALYYLSWAVIIGFVLIVVIGAVAKHGFGPLILASVLAAAVIGIVTLQ